MGGCREITRGSKTRTLVMFYVSDAQFQMKWICIHAKQWVNVGSVRSPFRKVKYESVCVFLDTAGLRRPFSAVN